MVKNIYSDIQTNLSKHNLFNHVKIIVKIIPDENVTYKIIKLAVEANCGNKALNEEITKICEDINQMLIDNTFNWRLFYLFKELFQRINKVDEDNTFNYFRGQSQNWPLQPGIFRPDTPHEFRDNFEKIYRKIAYQHPYELEYIEYSMGERIDRSKQLSILQHYGLRTSLADITSNPFIALLFMISGETSLINPVLDCFQIDEEIHYEKNIFIEVQRDDNNKRISAQKGAFLNYDYLYDIDGELEPINRVSIEIDIDTDLYIEYLRIEQLKLIKAAEEEDIDLTEVLDKGIEEMERKESDIRKTDFKKSIYSHIKLELRKKLEEYHYREEDLYPDLDKQIEYIQKKYLSTKTKRLTKK